MSTAVRFSVCFLFVVALVLAASAVPAAVGEVSGSVTHVTLYRGQAMITRTIPIQGPKGAREIVVGEMPAQVVAGSLFAEASEGAEVRAVRFRTRAVGQEPREEVRQFDLAIEEINGKLQLNKKGTDLLAKRSAYLDQLEGFVAPTAKAELSKGVLDAAALEKITMFSFEQRKTISTEQIKLEEEAKELNKELSLLQRKRSELTNGATRTIREAVLFLQKHAEQQETVRLNYLVSNCGWSPTYTFRAAGDQKDVAAECSALIHQMTGEDWNDVTLTLSTASPALSAAGPGLAPFPVSLPEAANQKKITPGDLTAQIQSIRGRQSAAILENRNAMKLSEIIGSSWECNTVANDLQCLELTNGKDLLSTLQAADARDGEGPSLSYRLPGPVSLASRSDQQMVRVLQTSFESRFYHVATPVLTSFVYREAELKNTSQQDLLAGPITVYLDGRFVGRSELPTVARGQTFVIGFGADPQLRARRELANRVEGVQGGNRELSFNYRLVIENYKEQGVPVRVFDRIPHSDRGADIRITMAEMKDPLCEDKLYLRTERSKGILRWDVQVPAAATGAKARMIEYGFTLDFDRTLALNTTGGSLVQLQQEFEELQRARLTH